MLPSVPSEGVRFPLPKVTARHPWAFLPAWGQASLEAVLGSGGQHPAPQLPFQPQKGMS